MMAAWISASPLARISADCAARMLVIARAFDRPLRGLPLIRPLDAKKKRPQLRGKLGPDFRSAGRDRTDTILMLVRNPPVPIKFGFSRRPNFRFAGFP
jgi:hypothetical protein